MKITNECRATCWCEFCSKKISKGEKFLWLEKQAQKGYARINICRECIIKIFIELEVKSKEISEIKKLLILNSLENEGGVS